MTQEQEENAQDNNTQTTTEATPLLADTEPERPHKRRKSRASLIAIITLILLAGLALILGFIVPQATQSYVEDAIQVNVDAAKLLEIQEKGAIVQISARTHLNATKAQGSAIRRRIANTILKVAGQISLESSIVKVYLEDGKSHQIGVANLSSIPLRLGNGYMNSFDVNASLVMKNEAVLGDFAGKVLDGTVTSIPLRGVVSTKLVKLLSIKQTIEQTINYDIPKGHTIPNFSLSNLQVKDMRGAGIAGSASLLVDMRLPIDATIPPMTFDLAIDGCNQEKIVLAQAANEIFTVSSTSPTIKLDGIAQCPYIPKLAMEKCKASGQSPLDRVVQQYLTGNSTTVIVSGAARSFDGKLSWIQDLFQHINVPITIPGNKNDQLARDIELLDLKFNLPSIIGGGSSKPKISGRIRGTIDIPKEINVAVKVKSVHVLADLIYKGKKFAYIESPGWSPATSDFPKPGEMQVQVVLKDAPVTITNQDVFSTIISQLFGGNVLVDVAGDADIRVSTGLGELEAHKLPIEAKGIEIGGLGFIGNIKPKIKEIGVLSSTKDSLELVALADVE